MKKFISIILFATLIPGCTKKEIVAVTPAPPVLGDSSILRRDSTHPILNHNFADTVPFAIVLYQGDQQLAPKGTTLPTPLIVVVKNKEGVALPGAIVSFTPGLNSGQVSSPLAGTDELGFAQTDWNLDPQANSSETVVAKVIYKNTNLAVTFRAEGLNYQMYNFSGTITMDSTNISYPLSLGSVYYFPDKPDLQSTCILKADNLNYSPARVLFGNILDISGSNISGLGRSALTHNIRICHLVGTVSNDMYSGNVEFASSEVPNNNPTRTISKGHFVATKL